MRKVQVMLGFCFTRKPKRSITWNYRSDVNKVQSPSNISKTNGVFKLEGWVCYYTLSISNNLIFCTRTPFLILLQRTDFWPGVSTISSLSSSGEVHHERADR